MKTFLIVFGIAVAGVLGFMSEPALRITLTGPAVKTPASVVTPEQPVAESETVSTIITDEPPPAPEPVNVPEDPPIQPEPQPEPEPAAEPQPEPTLDAEPAVEPEPEPVEPEEPVAVIETDVVKIMQKSIQDGDIDEFTSEQVLEWKAEAEETVDDEVFQTGTATYKAETIFGVKNIQAKALIQDGKVVRWVWPKSGVEIK
jgi:outer membrane biosynthesis protein TonB